MQFKTLFPILLTAAATIGISQANDGYSHSHSGTPRQLSNSDVNFGSPASVKFADRGYEFKLGADGKVSRSWFSVESSERVRFDLENQSNQVVAFVVGDEPAVAEYAQLFRKDPSNVSNDFHGVILSPGEKKNFAWKFDTFGNPKVMATYITLDGEYQKNKAPVSVTRSRDR
ncbi:hypothetical protein [Chitinimonas naiadis]